ncbi:MAG: alpha-amylase family glycosyl hydrolase, partial [Bacteroidota bacterium]
MKATGHRLIVLFTFLIASFSLSAQDVLLQAWYWDYPKPGCDVGQGQFNGESWAKTLESQAATLAEAGFTFVWLPPMTNASFGNCSNGYDPRNLYDLQSGFGSTAETQQCINTINSLGMTAVADVVYNHRDGGQAENNPGVQNYIQGNGVVPFPSDRYRCVFPVGANTDFGAGDYYFKISSKSQGFGGAGYKVYMYTNTSASQPFQGSITESEPNGGGDCGEGFNVIELNTEMQANLDGSDCRTDEFK